MPVPVRDAILLLEQTAPSTPASTRVALYAKADGQLYSMDDAGIETRLGLALDEGLAMMGGM